MSTYDIKKDRKELYAPGARDFTAVDVPELGYLMADGRGDPNTATAYAEAVEALYTASYAVRAVAKTQLDKVHTVGPLEGLWSAEDLAVFRTRDKDSWDWTMMIVQPGWITRDVVDEALAVATEKKGLPALGRLRFEAFAEGRCVQILHVGSYDDEGPTLERLHDEYLPAHGLEPRGRHHEIYLSDARRTEPARLRTILRQPVAPAG
ncbi:GyrI-like domain-containing protein [Antribacter gilvus]|uniref:GyrI-like domain-containing protein n=1 Tax=Antribacter gilvus TaxID=2304675 RepID=UPI000F7784DF|nr:GyrI-like domain-containing protein [Antribacter gilvus]